MSDNGAAATTWFTQYNVCGIHQLSTSGKPWYALEATRGGSISKQGISFFNRLILAFT
jgi:hypothetical protein